MHPKLFTEETAFHFTLPQASSWWKYNVNRDSEIYKKKLIIIIFKKKEKKKEKKKRNLHIDLHGICFAYLTFLVLIRIWPIWSTVAPVKK